MWVTYAFIRACVFGCSLLVDFNAFPNKFIELVESCLASSSSDGSTRAVSSTAGPKSSGRELHSEPHFLARCVQGTTQSLVMDDSVLPSHASSICQA